MKVKLYSLALSLLALLALGCDSAPPVSPEGTVLNLSANPTRIATDGQAQVRVVARKPNGTPVNPGTQIFLDTDLGNLPALVETDANGEAVAVFRASGSSGTATVSASTGTAETQMVEITVGLQANQLRLTASPTTVPIEFGVDDLGVEIETREIDLLATVWDDRGDLLPGAQVLFASDVGRLESDGALVETGENGQVSESLILTEEDLTVVANDEFEVRAETVNASGVVSDMVTIFIARPPRANFNFTVSGLTVTFTDTSTGDPTSWFWDFGDGNNSEARNPSHIYQQAGSYLVSLEASNAAGTDRISRTITVIGGN